MDSFKEELHSDNEDCPVSSPFEEVAFVVKHELLFSPETVPVTQKTDVDGSRNSGAVKQEEEDEVTVESHEMIPGSEMQLTYQEEFVLGSTLPKEFCPGDVSKEECGRMADMCGEKPYNFIHIDERAYKCELCTKEFLKIGWLVRHKATHSAANPYICDFCNREFARKLSLKVHIRTHTGEKPYKCSVCSKIFTTCSALSRHAQVHLRAQPEENAYKCEVCSKIFTTRSALYGHTRIHSIWSIQN